MMTNGKFWNSDRCLSSQGFAIHIRQITELTDKCHGRRNFPKLRWCIIRKWRIQFNLSLNQPLFLYMSLFLRGTVEGCEAGGGESGGEGGGAPHAFFSFFPCLHVGSLCGEEVLYTRRETRRKFTKSSEKWCKF